jgi:tetratricopeptide (TPR) repeat protein
LVEEIEADWPPPAGDPLRSPASLDDALAILKLDQTNLYGVAVEVAAKNRDLDGLALEAQIELAWGEAYTVLMDILLRLVWQFDKRSMPLETKADLSKADLGQLDRLRQITRRTSRLVEAFQLVWVVHVSRGMHLARQVIEKYPDSYLGYRLAADYYRTTRDWEKFDAMVQKIAQRNPDSNGLRFLRAAAAYQRDDDRETAERLYREALAQDPEFVRAQAHLVVMQRDADDLHREYQALADKNPNHPIVRWAGGLIEIAHRSFGAR